MTPLLANSINVPYFLMLGALVLIPLMAFEVFVESAILRRTWKLSWDDLFRFTLKANIWSLVAGIPVKFLNAALYQSNLPKDLPSFFEAYPFWVGIGASIYFVVTVATETLYASRSVHGAVLGFKRILAGVLLANVATYAVLAPLHYSLTKPNLHGTTFERDIQWTKHPNITLLYLDTTNLHLKAANLDQSNLRTIVPFPVKDFQVSEDLKTWLYRSPDDDIHLYQTESAKNTRVFERAERITMNEAAFSLSGRYVALLENRETLLLANAESGTQSSFSLSKKVGAARLLWSNEEKKFYLDPLGTNQVFLVAEIGEGDQLTVEALTNSPSSISAVFFSDTYRSYQQDACGNLEAWTVRGIGSYLKVYDGNETKFQLRVNMGLLGMSAFTISQVVFLADCNELIFESKGHLYLLNLKENKVGTIGAGEDFILLTDRYRKGL